MKKEPVKEILVKILTRYDVFTIQEIRDASGEAFPELIAALNEEEDRYDFHVGERQGKVCEVLPHYSGAGEKYPLIVINILLRKKLDGC